MGALLGSITALCIGISDMFGRRVTAASSAMTASAVMQVVAAAAALASVSFVDSTWLWDDVLLGGLSGLGMAVGLSCYFGGLQRAGSAIVAPLVATLSAVVPYVYTLVRGTSPTALAAIGAGVALIGLLLVTVGGSSADHMRTGLLWGLASGAGYGFGLTIVIETSSDSGVWPSVSQRVVAFVFMLVVATVLGAPKLPPAGVRFAGAVGGVFAGVTSLAFIYGVQVDAQPTVVTAGLFPIASVAGGWLFYDDQVSRTQAAGIAVALAGVTAIVIS